MAVLLLVLAIIGAAVVGDLVVENTATGTITVLNHPVSSYSHGLLLAMVAAIGFVVGLLVIGSVTLRRSRRVRRKQLRTAERELRGQLLELDDENTRLREELARREGAERRVAGVAAAADLDAPSTAQRLPSPLGDRREELVDAEARRAARLRSYADLPLPSSHR
jgi:uncharacterized membrane protein YciS (DUF1049 family)